MFCISIMTAKNAVWIAALPFVIFSSWSNENFRAKRCAKSEIGLQMGEQTFSTLTSFRCNNMCLTVLIGCVFHIFHMILFRLWRLVTRFEVNEEILCNWFMSGGYKVSTFGSWGLSLGCWQSPDVSTCINQLVNRWAKFIWYLFDVHTLQHYKLVS
jgi:hypothetical protein